jgi:hypothetical protein
MSDLSTKEHDTADIEADLEHISRRAGTFLVGATFDKAELGKHHIEHIDTHVLEHLKKTPDGQIILIPQPTDDPQQSLNVSPILFPTVAIFIIVKLNQSSYNSGHGEKSTQCSLPSVGPPLILTSYRSKLIQILAYCTLMTDLTSAWTIPLVLPQAEYWGITPSNAGRNLSGNIFVRT